MAKVSSKGVVTAVKGGSAKIKIGIAGGSWTNIAAASGKTATYGLTAQSRQNGYQYRCKITDSAGNVIYSKVVKLSVK